VIREFQKGQGKREKLEGKKNIEQGISNDEKSPVRK
jgi:hypothetical protein